MMRCYLYVATSGIYGDGGLFKLDLIDRVFDRLLPKSSAKYSDQLQMGYFTKIEKLDLKKGVITVGIYLYGETHNKLIARESVPLD
jgi:hypothetical protein